MGKGLFSESVVIMFILMTSQRMEHLPGHLANKVVPRKHEQMMPHTVQLHNLQHNSLVNKVHDVSDVMEPSKSCHALGMTSPK